MSLQARKPEIGRLYLHSWMVDEQHLSRLLIILSGLGPNFVSFKV